MLSICIETVVDPHHKLEAGSRFYFARPAAFLPSATFSFFLPKIRGGGEGQVPWAPPLDPPLSKNIFSDETLKGMGLSNGISGKIWNTFREYPCFLFLLNDWKITVSSICFFTLPGVPKFLDEMSSRFYFQREMKWNSPLSLFSLINKYTL